MADSDLVGSVDLAREGLCCCQWCVKKLDPYLLRQEHAELRRRRGAVATVASYPAKFGGTQVVGLEAPKKGVQ